MVTSTSRYRLVKSGILRSVVSWELAGLLIIGVFEIISLLWKQPLMISIVTIIILTIITIWFGSLVSRMRELI